MTMKVCSSAIFESAPSLLELNMLPAEIREDVLEECKKFGNVLSLKIPRPIGGNRQSAGVGKIYVKFEQVESATKALRALAGRKFSDRTVVTTYFPEVRSKTNS
jgi:RNA recognition motif.